MQIKKKTCLKVQQKRRRKKKHLYLINPSVTRETGPLTSCPGLNIKWNKKRFSWHLLYTIISSKNEKKFFGKNSP